MELSVVIAEDELIARMDLLRLIDWKAHGCRIVGEAQNGREAISLIESLRPDLVITDVRMPVHNGIEVIAHFRHAEHRPEFLIVSGFDDYEMVRQGLILGALDYLLKFDLNEQKLLAAIERARQHLSEKRAKKAEQGQQEMAERQLRWNLHELQKNFFTDVINGYPPSGPARDEAMRFLDIRLDADIVYSLILRAGEMRGFEDTTYSQTVHLNQAVLGIMEDILSEEHHAYAFEGRSSEFIAFASAHEQKQGELQRLLKATGRVVEMLWIYLNLPAKLGVGWSEGGQSALESAYQRAERALNSRLPKADQAVILWTEVPEAPDPPHGVAQTGIKSQGELESQAYHIHIAHAKEYIQRHFQNPLSLSEVAAVSGFNPSYFSTLFKRQMNMTFSEYINVVRIEHAKKLLLETNHRVYEVAGLCGYMDVGYFFRTFRKVTGQSPGEYCKRSGIDIAGGSQ